MKKLISLILATILLLSISCVTAHAEDSQVYEGSASTTITYRVQSSYCILIPEYIDADCGQYTFQADYLNVANGERVFVVVSNVDENGRILFTHDNGENTLKKNIVTSGDTDVPQYCVGCFYGEDTNSKISFCVGEENYEADYLKAGNYSATVEFSVYLGN